MKKCLVSGLVLSSLMASQAYAFQAIPYVGAAFGRTDGSWKFNNARQNIISKYDRLLGFNGNFFAGYDLVFGKLALAGEVTAGTGNTRFTFDSTAANANDLFKFNNYFGFGLVPSYQINGQLLFSRVMMVWGKLQYETTITLQQQGEFSRYERGGLFGVGMLAPLSKRFALRTEYDWSLYGNVTTTASGGASMQWKRNMLDTMMMGLNYYFGDRFNTANLTRLAHGFYMGIGGSRDLPRLDERRITTTATEDWKKGLSGLAGRVLAGFDFHPHFRSSLSRVNLGVEATASYSNAEYKYTDIAVPGNSYKFRMRDAYTLAGVLGVNVNPADEVFITAGGAAARFNKAGGQSLGLNFNKYRMGYVVGIGNTMAMTSNLSLRLDGEFSQYGKINNVGQDGNSYRWRPQDERATLSLVYTVS